MVLVRLLLLLLVSSSSILIGMVDLNHLQQIIQVHSLDLWGLLLLMAKNKLIILCCSNKILTRLIRKQRLLLFIIRVLCRKTIIWILRCNSIRFLLLTKKKTIWLVTKDDPKQEMFHVKLPMVHKCNNLVKTQLLANKNATKNKELFAAKFLFQNNNNKVHFCHNVEIFCLYNKNPRLYNCNTPWPNKQTVKKHIYCKTKAI